MRNQTLKTTAGKVEATGRTRTGRLADSPPGAAAFKLSDKEFNLFRSLIYSKSGINLTPDRKDLLTNRLAKRIRKGGFKSYRQYYDYVMDDQSGQELVQLLNMISTNLTYFFRESQHFNMLKDTVLPQMIKAKQKKHDRRIRFWSAACSTGEEVYSLLLTVLPFLSPPSSWDFKLLGSDISTKVLSTAKTGRYDKSQIKGIDPLRLQEVFEVTNQTMAFKPEWRSMVKFARLNLLEPFPFKGGFDVIFCRNVMIYFDQSTREKLVNKFYQYLTPGGYLFIGHSENLNGLNQQFTYVNPAVYRK